MKIDFEEIVQLVLTAYDKSFVDERNPAHLNRANFELELRRVLMQNYRHSTSPTYTIPPGSPMGTWTIPYKYDGGTGTATTPKTLITG
jgi:hypothetical protein